MTTLETKADAEALINKEGIEYVSVRFTDLIGVQQHFTVPASEFLKDAFDEGMPFDGSSIEGFQAINESDMKLVPDIETAFVDPFRKHKTLDVAFSIVDPLTDEPYSRDPRQVAAKAESYLKSTGIADTASFAPEAEFFIFDKVRFGNDMRGSFYEIDSIEAPWNSGLDVEADGTPNIGFKNRVKRGYFPVPPMDHTQDLRDDMVANLQKVGLILERAHHEVGGAGQQEINYRFNSLQHAGDDLMKYKYVIHETAALAGKAATFMPKPLAGDNGTGMHCHQSLWKDGKPLFYDEKNYGGLSDLARWYIGGLIKHSSAVLAFTNPSLNSYHRLVPGFEAPVNLVYSARNRSAAIRIPLAGTSPAATRSITPAAREPIMASSSRSNGLRISKCASSFPVTRVSSAHTVSAARSASSERSVISPKFPMGVGTMISFPAMLAFMVSPCDCSALSDNLRPQRRRWASVKTLPRSRWPMARMSTMHTWPLRIR